MKVLELFAGSRSFGKVAEEYNCQVFSSDIEQVPGISYAIDILEFDVEKVPFIPDLIWASPVCTAFSKASADRHFKKNSLGIYEIKSVLAIKSVWMVSKTLEIISYFLKRNKNLTYYIENPVGRLSKLDFMKPNNLFSEFKIDRLVLIHQCQYGRKSKKPTHIWTNDLDWKQRKLCTDKTGTCHPISVQDVGTWRLGNRNYKRSNLPRELCEEIIKHNLAKHKDCTDDILLGKDILF